MKCFTVADKKGKGNREKSWKESMQIYWVTVIQTQRVEKGPNVFKVKLSLVLSVNATQDERMKNLELEMKFLRTRGEMK